MSGKSSIIYEQPMNETMRLCLRLENLFQQIHDNMLQPHPLNSKLALISLLQAVTVVDRPDLKSKLTQMLTQQSTALTQLGSSPLVDSYRLSSILQQLEKASSMLYQRSRIGDALKQNEFLNQVRLQTNNPGGLNDHAVPAFVLWMDAPPNKRTQDLQAWFDEFRELDTALTLLLQIIRQGTPLQSAEVTDGYYHKTLDSSHCYQLVRVEVPSDLCVYPEFSVGKHRLNIRFLQTNFSSGGNAKQFTRPIQFKFCCCRI